MHVDYLSATMSEDSHSSVLDSITPILAHMGVVSAFEGLYKLRTGGTLKTGASRGAAYHVSASGDFLGVLRAQGLWAEYLMLVAAVPHRVTRMDIAHDIGCDAPAELQKFKRRVERGSVSLTHKKLDLQNHYNSIMSLDRDGRESGTVYVGPKSVQVAGLKVYDKSKEQFDKFRREIPSTLRWELKLGRKSGVSLRDAYEPDPVFWHYMAPVLRAPDGVPSWSPHDAQLSLPARVSLLPAESMKRALEGGDIVKRLFTLCDLMGPHGIDHLVRLLTREYDRHLVNKSSTPNIQKAG